MKLLGWLIAGAVALLVVLPRRAAATVLEMPALAGADSSLDTQQERPLIGAGLPIASRDETVAAATSVVPQVAPPAAVKVKTTIAEVVSVEPQIAMLLNTVSPYFDTTSATTQQQHVWIARRHAIAAASGALPDAADSSVKQFVFDLWYALTGQRITAIFGVP